MGLAISQASVDAEERVWSLTPLGRQRVDQLRRWQEIASAAESRRQGRAAGTICAHCPADFEMEHDEETCKQPCRHGGIAAHAQCELADDDERGVVDADGDDE